ncbi:shikimate kinase [Methanoculleus chikugoensis]|uniref:shikimate kinase n=1 Tax=Methanoculleus chikugoensis TaxID=118126 RepID=UPI000ADAE388|nr:shikimate kinase [Methanoculleus chikugoensis]
MHYHENIVLIGMPGAGKSTVGVVLAKSLGMQFIDTDILIQERTGKMLQEILDEDGADAFKRIEEETILSLHSSRAVIATGGSVVRSEAAMAHLKSEGVVVYLEIAYEEMEARLKNITPGGGYSSSRARASARCTTSASRSTRSMPISPSRARARISSLWFSAWSKRCERGGLGCTEGHPAERQNSRFRAGWPGHPLRAWLRGGRRFTSGPSGRART